MKRHMRDLHEIITDSTSPPLKRKKNVPGEEDQTAVTMETEEVEVQNLSSRFEEMEVDDSEEDLKEASAMMDEKIKNLEDQITEYHIVEIEAQPRLGETAGAR